MILKFIKTMFAGNFYDDKEVEVSKRKFRNMVVGGDYHDSDYLYALSG